MTTTDTQFDRLAEIAQEAVDALKAAIERAEAAELQLSREAMKVAELMLEVRTLRKQRDLFWSQRDELRDEVEQLNRELSKAWYKRYRTPNIEVVQTEKATSRLLEEHGVIPAAGAPRFCAASAPTPTLNNLETVKDLLIKAESEASELRAQVERRETRIKVLEVANDSLTQYSRNLTRERDDALFTAQTLKDERDALQARIDAGTQVWSTDTDLSVREWVDCPMEQATLTARVIDVQAVEPSV